MIWILGSAALLVAIFLAFRFAGSPGRLYATLAVVAILAAAGSLLLYIESRRSNELRSESTSRITPADIAISEATLTHEYGRWYLRGMLTNNAKLTAASLTVRVTVQECVDEPCKTTGETETTRHGMRIPPGESRNFEILLYLPKTPVPTKMEWDYEVVGVGAAR